MLLLDLETRSQVDLALHGLRRYAEDRSTQIICMAYAFDDDPIEFWSGDEPFPQVVIDHILDGKTLMAHNAEFERHLFDWVIAPDYNFDAPRIDQWRCSMALGLASGYAAGLDTLAVTLGLPYRKLLHGRRLIKDYCMPGHLTKFKPGDANLMKQYCIGDVEVMRAAVKCLRPLTDAEWHEYHINAEINDRGLPIDVAFCEAALEYSTEIARDANREIEILTHGVMTKASQRKSRDLWIKPRLSDDQIEMITVTHKDVEKLSFDREHRQPLLECDDLSPEVRELLEQMDAAGSSALKKFNVAVKQHVNGRIHNTFLWNGAGRTGRFSGKGIQPHNFRRDVYGDNEAEALIADVKNGIVLDRPATTMARLLRSMITHRDGLYWVDWSQIEGRVAPWLANSPEGEIKLDIFRDGRDVYTATAANMKRVSEAQIDATQRQAGKIAELSLQFGGGYRALIGMGKGYGMLFEEEEARGIVKDWRLVNEWAENIWDEYEQAIKSATKEPNIEYPVGRVTFQSDSINFLWCRLPSGRLLSYPKPRREGVTTPWGETHGATVFQTHFRPAAGALPIRIPARGALIFQNTVQAVAADILREALMRAHDEGLDIVGHCHDEVIGIGTQEDGDRLDNIMLEQPTWAAELPIATGGVSHGTRYGK